MKLGLLLDIVSPPGGTGVPPIDPATLFFSFIYRDLLATMQDNLGGSASYDELISLWGDYSGMGNDATEATNFPTIRTNGMQAGTNITMSLGTPVASASLIEFWAVGSRSTGQIWTPIGQGSGGQSCVSLYSDGNVYFVKDTGGYINVARDITGTFLFHLWRDAGNNVHFEATGVADTTIGNLPGTATSGCILGRAGFDYSNSACRFKFIGLKDGFLLTAPQKAGLLSWLQLNYGVTL